METITAWVLAWLLLATHSVIPFVYSVEQYLVTVVNPAVEERLQEASNVVEQVRQNVASTSSVSSTSSTSSTSIAVAAKVAVKKSVEEIKSIPIVVKNSVITRTQVSQALTPEETLASTNARRYREGLVLLENNPVLTAIAQKKAKDMIVRNYFAHESPTGQTIGDLAKEAGYGYLTVGENLAFGDFKSSALLVDAWMNSPGHRANIMNTAYTEIGVAVVEGTINGQKGWVAVQEFGLPKSVCPEPDAKARATLEELNTQIDTLDAELVQKKKIIANMSHSNDSYPTLVSEYNESIASRNSLVTLYTLAAKKYNALIEVFNMCVAQKLNK